MTTRHTLVSIGLPVRNGEKFLGDSLRSVLAQNYDRLELVISDNASDDGTEEICRDAASSDSRVRYIRQPRNIGLVNNFNTVLHRANGTFFKWLGDDDWLESSYISRCVDVFAEDESLLLVTTQQVHVDADGTHHTSAYDGSRMRSDNPVVRFTEMLHLLNDSYLLLDPLYAMMRRERVAQVPRPNMVYEDQVFASRLALAGPFGHLPEVLSFRRFKPFVRPAAVARRFGVPTWQARMATLLQCRELRRAVRECGLSPDDRRRADAAIARMFLRRQRLTAVHRTRKLVGLATNALPRHAAHLS